MSGKNGKGDDKENVKLSRYNPSPASRFSHNMKERDRRARMKVSCEIMRTLIPGVDPRTDKATVMEHAVNYLLHLRQCLDNKCSCGDPSKDATQVILTRPTKSLDSTEDKTTCDGVAVTEAVEYVHEDQTDEDPMDDNEDAMMIRCKGGDALETQLS